MIAPRHARVGLVIVLVAMLFAGVITALRSSDRTHRVTVTAYFDNTNGLFPGDDVRILGVRVGEIDTIEPQPTRAKVTFSFDDQYRVPADAKAAIVSPTLVTARAIQLVPAYPGSGPTMREGAVIPQDRTAVPVEFDDFRLQLERLTQTLQPTEPGGVSPFGALINTAADNLRGQGPAIRDSLIKLSQAFSVLGDHSKDIFGTVKNLATLVSALQSSTDLMRSLNINLASVTALLANDPDEIATAVKDLSAAALDVQAFVAENRDPLGDTTDKLASLSQAINESLDDVKQTLHVLPNTVANGVNMYMPSHSATAGLLAFNNFANPISFICGAIQAASRQGAEKSAKLCVQYLAPIIKNRQYNFPPLGINAVVGATARPNEITYSEDWMRPDHVPSQPTSVPDPLAAEAPNPANPPAVTEPAAATAPVIATDPAGGLPGLMMPPPGGQR